MYGAQVFGVWHMFFHQQFWCMCCGISFLSSSFFSWSKNQLFTYFIVHPLVRLLHHSFAIVISSGATPTSCSNSSCKSSPVRSYTHRLVSAL